MNTAQILKKPLMTEKSTREREGNRYVLEVDLHATKGDIRIALQTRYKVDVVSVHTLRTAGKFRRRGQFRGDHAHRKKAILHIKPGQKNSREETKQLIELKSFKPYTRS